MCIYDKIWCSSKMLFTEIIIHFIKVTQTQSYRAFPNTSNIFRMTFTYELRENRLGLLLV